MNTQLKGINTGEAALIEAYERTRQNNSTEQRLTSTNQQETEK